MTIQVSDSDSGLFRFIHDCGHPVIKMEKSGMGALLSELKHNPGGGTSIYTGRAVFQGIIFQHKFLNGV